MKKTLFVLTLLIGGLGFSQNSEKAKALLNEVSAKIKSYENVSLDFKYALDNASEQIKQETPVDHFKRI